MRVLLGQEAKSNAPWCEVRLTARSGLGTPRRSVEGRSSDSGFTAFAGGQSRVLDVPKTP